MSKVWLVTGSASGLGRSIAEAVLASGDRGCHSAPGKWHEMNRKQRRETMRKIHSQDLSLEVCIPMPPALTLATSPTT